MTDERHRAAIDPMTLAPRLGSSYPGRLKQSTAGREKRALGDVFGLSQFGVNLVRVPPGSASALRHWHSHEDELVYLLEGELVLVTDAGEQPLGPGMVAGFPAGVADGHMLVNRSAATAVYIEVGSRFREDRVVYPDDDLLVEPRDGGHVFTNRKGEPYR